MAEGTFSGGVCYFTQVEAAKAECSAYKFNAYSSAVTCEGVLSAPSATAGGAVTVSLNQRSQLSRGSFAYDPVDRFLPGCDADIRGPFVLSASDGTLVAFAILAVWGIAWAWRAFGKALNTDQD